METFGLDAIFKALDISLDRRKAGFAIGGLFITVVVAGLFGYIAGEARSGFISLVFGLLAIVTGWVLSVLIIGTLAKMSYSELSSGQAMHWRAALAYSRAHLSTLLLSPIALGVGIVLAVLAQIVLLFLGRIPYLGDLWVAAIFLPLIVVNVFINLLVLLGNWLIPVVVAAEGGSTMDTLRRLVGLVRRAPGQIVAYLSIAIILGLVAALILMPLVYSALVTTAGLSVVGLGAGRSAEFMGAPTGLLDSPFSLDLFDLPYGMFGGVRSVPFTMRLARLILTLTTALIPVVIFAELFLVFPIACASAAYLSVTGKRATTSAKRTEPIESPESLFCINCGAELPPGTKFCVQCGASQEAASARE